MIFIKLTTKDIPYGDRPDDRCLSVGASSLSDAELLAIIFRTGSTGITSTDLAHLLLQAAPGTGLVGLNSLRYEDMVRIDGIGKVKALQILAICEIARRMSAAKAVSRISLKNPATISDFFMETLRHLTQEHFIIAMFNSNNELITHKLITIGTINASIAAPREIFIEALKQEAVYIVLIHNHPSGSASPSKGDELVTKRIKECGELIGIKVIDHIIIGDNKYFSFREAGIM
ncbi:MAG: DNA repair protein RadC [Lachnospiraceae bacterium]|nr:DNA repair protein RadC [Lachnospiraceae bacterium]